MHAGMKKFRLCATAQPASTRLPAHYHPGVIGMRQPPRNTVYRDSMGDLPAVDDVVVREASTKDVPAVLGLLDELGRPAPADHLEIEVFGRMVERYIADDDKRVLVILAGGRVAGMASVLLLPRLNRSSSELYMPELVVSQQYRGRGLGKALVRYCIRLAAESGCHRIRLESGNRRTSSHRFYLDLGFEQSALSFSRDAG